MGLFRQSTVVLILCFTSSALSFKRLSRGRGGFDGENEECGNAITILPPGLNFSGDGLNVWAVINTTETIGDDVDIELYLRMKELSRMLNEINPRIATRFNICEAIRNNRVSITSTEEGGGNVVDCPIPIGQFNVSGRLSPYAKEGLELTRAMRITYEVIATNGEGEKIACYEGVWE
ncbi:unnamed protein product [Cyprideis torosa]|uniref:Uncharacterized protein n=1 Tax=Cyprideis torosa TaxID=163714 RepID=A0A7R8WCZ3_9CRUS|nr:unnamed protein product [Cyprideis torosa]CAG0888009.1 unnamed protein product [Cyprideis torosa]